MCCKCKMFSREYKENAKHGINNFLLMTYSNDNTFNYEKYIEINIKFFFGFKKVK